MNNRRGFFKRCFGILAALVIPMPLVRLKKPNIAIAFGIYNRFEDSDKWAAVTTNEIYALRGHAKLVEGKWEVDCAVGGLSGTFDISECPICRAYTRG